MRLQYTSSSSSSTSLAAAGLAPCLLPGAGGSGLAGGGCSCCWGCCYGALLFFLWTSAAVTASSSSSSSSSAAGGAGGAAVSGAPGSAGASGAAASTPHSPAPPLPAAVVLVAAAAGAGGAGAGVSPAVCYTSPGAGSVQELAQRSRVVLEGKVQQQQQGKRKHLPDQHDLVTGAKGQQLEGYTEPQVTQQATAWIAASAASLTTIATIALTGSTDSSAASPAPLHTYLVKVHQVWPVKSAGLDKDSLITVQGDFGSGCLKLKEDSRYIFFMDPTNATSVFKASYPPLETGRSLKKDVGRVLCRGCGKSLPPAQSL